MIEKTRTVDAPVDITTSRGPPCIFYGLLLGYLLICVQFVPEKSFWTFIFYLWIANPPVGKQEHVYNGPNRDDPDPVWFIVLPAISHPPTRAPLVGCGH